MPDEKKTSAADDFQVLRLRAHRVCEEAVRQLGIDAKVASDNIKKAAQAIRSRMGAST